MDDFQTRSLLSVFVSTQKLPVGTLAFFSFCFASLPWWSVWVELPFTALWAMPSPQFVGTFPKMQTSTSGRSSAGYLTSSTGSQPAHSSVHLVCTLEELALGLQQSPLLPGIMRSEVMAGGCCWSPPIPVWSKWLLCCQIGHIITSDVFYSLA